MSSFKILCTKFSSSDLFSKKKVDKSFASGFTVLGNQGVAAKNGTKRLFHCQVTSWPKDGARYPLCRAGWAA